MKLRIKGNSLRLRLTQSEVAQIQEGKQVTEQVHFGLESEQKMTYSLAVAKEIEEVKVTYQEGRIVVWLPYELGKKWAETNQVTIKASKQVGVEETLQILVEKDFKCLNIRPGEDESDNFPHPKEDKVTC